MKKITIEIDEEVFGFLQKKARPFIDTPNDVLRRLLLRTPLNMPIGELYGPRPAEEVFSMLPKDLPKALAHTIQVAYLVWFRKMPRSKATSLVATYHGVAPQTIIDKYCRQLDLTANQFDMLLREDDLTTLKKLLQKKFPDYFDIIRVFLSVTLRDEDSQPVR